jgi:hypothetical protein
VFYTGQIVIGTGSVAMDRLLLDFIETSGAPTVQLRSGIVRALAQDRRRARDADPSVNIIIRELGQPEYVPASAIQLIASARLLSARAMRLGIIDNAPRTIGTSRGTVLAPDVGFAERGRSQWNGTRTRSRR